MGWELQSIYARINRGRFLLPTKATTSWIAILEKFVILATWKQLSEFHGVLQINMNRLSAQELRRRHLPMTTQFIPLLERGQAEGVFRSDVSATWLIAAIRAIVHVASTELQAGRLTQADVERTMLTTALATVSPQ